MPEISTNRLAINDDLGGLTLTLVAILTLLAAAPAAQAPVRGNSAATITGAFADSCRDFTARSTKDISYVELHYVAGGVVRNESIDSHEHAIDGGVGDEIEVATVKAGTTIEEFTCLPSNRAPTALLEIQTPPIDHTGETCYWFWEGGLACEQSSPRTAWTNNSQVPTTGGSEAGLFHWVTGGLVPPSQVSWMFTFRGIGSNDPDADVASWSLDFGDGTSVSGTWSAPPTDLTHVYSPGFSNCTGVVGNIRGVCVVTLTVTDSAGQSDSDVIRMVFVDLIPD